MSNQTVTVNGGVSFFGLLTIAFIVLKLCGVIGWSWWWVISPLFLPLLIVFGIAAVILIFAVIIGMAKDVYRMISGT